jgi:hypothetical protein
MNKNHRLLALLTVLALAFGGMLLPRTLYAAGDSPPLALRFDGATGDHAGYAVASADVNGDGYSDTIIGGWLASPVVGGTPRDGAGAVYVIFGRAEPYSSTLTPATLGNNGYVIAGSAEDDNLGWMLANAGDLNSDGNDDLIIGAPLAAPAGATFVVFGKSTTDTIDLASTGAWGYRINGAASGDRVGYGVSGVGGDLNEDGIDDLLVGAISTDFTGATAGSTYVLFGKTTTDTVNLAALGAGGWRIDGEGANHRFGTSVAGVPDLNGDGVPEILGGAYSASPNGSNSGAAYLVFGKAHTDTVSLSTLGNQGFAVRGGAVGDRIGISVASVADQNSDGKAELLLGREENNAGTGGAVVVFGKSTTNTLTVNALGSAGYRINGSASDDNLGYAVAGLGDVNHDGIADLLVGGFNSSPNGVAGAGSAYAVYGQATTDTITLSDVPTEAMRYDGVSGGERAGRGVAGGDFNGDGVDDIMVGADLAGAGMEGTVYVYLSPAPPVLPPTDVTLTGATAVAVGATETYTAGITPLTTSLPLTYTWQIGSETPVVLTDGLTSTFTVPWTTPGTFTINVAATNDAGTVTETQTVVVAAPPTFITLTAAPTSTVGTTETYTASVTPLTTTLPLTYSWAIIGDNTTTVVFTDGLTSTFTTQWTISGSYVLQVEATNSAGTVSASQVVVVEALPPTAVTLAALQSNAAAPQGILLYALVAVGGLLWWCSGTRRHP